MRWEMSPELLLFQESLRDWLGKTAEVDRVRAWLDAGDATEFAGAFGGDGWAGVGFPEEVGGQGGGLLELAVSSEELGRRAAPSGRWLATAVAGRLLDGTTGPAALDEGSCAALVVDAHLPPDADPHVVLDDARRLHGTVTRVVGAASDGVLLVPAMGPDGAVVVTVAADTAGVTVTPLELLDRSRSAAVVSFDGATAVPLDIDVTYELGEAALRAAVLVAADSLGAMEQMLDLAVVYSTQREQFGKPIGAFQAVKHAAAEMLVAVEAARSIVFYAAASVDAGLADRAVHAAVAKAQVGASGARVADSALTLHGAIGYTWEHSLHLFYKRAKADAVLWGSTAAWNERVAASLPLLPD